MSKLPEHKQNKALILEMTGISDQQYHRVVMNQALGFIYSRYRKEVADILKVMPHYWGWWMNHWYRIDAELIDELELHSYRPSANDDLRREVRLMWVQEHRAKMDGLQPGKAIMRSATRILQGREQLVLLKQTN